MPRKRKRIGQYFKYEKTKRYAARKQIRNMNSVQNDHSYCQDTHKSFNTYPMEEETWSDDNWQTAMQAFLTEEISSPESEYMDSDGATADEFYVVLDKVYMYHPDEDLDSFVRNILLRKIFSVLRQELKQGHFPDYTLLETEDNIKLLQFYPADIPSVKWSVCVDSACQASIYVHRNVISYDKDFWFGIPHSVYSLSDLQNIVDKLASFRVCVGNCEEKFVKIVTEGATLLSSFCAYREVDCGAIYRSTIRSNKCQFLVQSNERCRQCQIYRGSLRKKECRVNRPRNRPEDITKWQKSHNNMTRPELTEKLSQLKSQFHSLQRDHAKLKRAVLKYINPNSENFDITSCELMQLVKCTAKDKTTNKREVYRTVDSDPLPMKKQKH